MTLLLSAFSYSLVLVSDLQRFRSGTYLAKDLTRPKSQMKTHFLKVEFFGFYFALRFGQSWSSPESIPLGYFINAGSKRKMQLRIDVLNGGSLSFAFPLDAKRAPPASFLPLSPQST
jgi:hypothetical protein